MKWNLIRVTPVVRRDVLCVLQFCHAEIWLCYKIVRLYHM